MKIGIIGAGMVGGATALKLAQMELGEVVMVDIIEGLPQGKGLDMAESMPLEDADTNIVGSNDFGVIEGADVVVVTSGLPRKPGMTRSDLLMANADIIEPVSKEIKERAPNSIIVMVTNPLDTMCYVAMKVTGFPRERVIGQAGVLDSTRMCCFVAKELDVSVEDVDAMVLGGHGDSMVPLPRYTTVSGIPITQLLRADAIERINDRTRKGGTEIVNLLKTGSAYYAPAAAVAIMVEAIVRNKKRVLPASVYLQGEYGLNDVFTGVPVKLGAGGLEQIIEVDLTEEEKAALHRSAADVRKDIDTWEQARKQKG